MTLLTERNNIHVTKVENHVATRMNSDAPPMMRSGYHEDHQIQESGDVGVESMR